MIKFIIFWIEIIVFASSLNAYGAHGLFEIGLGAGGASTTGTVTTSTSAPALDLAGGWHWGRVQLKGEILYSSRYPAQGTYSNGNNYFPYAAFAGALLGVTPWNNLVVEGGYGLASAGFETTSAGPGLTTVDQKIFYNPAWIVGLDFYPFGNDHARFGILTRYSQLSANNYFDTASSQPGTVIGTTINGSTTTSAWFVLGGLLMTWK